MKARLDAIIQREQADYLDNLLTNNDPLLAEMEKFAAEHRVPIADREVARFLEITARTTGARKALEIGMAIGYSVVHLARGMGERGLVVTIEPNEEMISAANGYLDRANLMDQVKIERGKALDVMPGIEDTFDLLYIDAVKEEYKQYLDLGIPMLRPGGVIIVDNLLWGGKVAVENAANNNDASTVALREFNSYFVNHPRLLAEVLPIGDGLGYAAKQ
ncbi:MAG TPA: O-methyltransferase [Pyrinomonadaceae bacterium]|nr:O-methyltransferase [Pyrinomonadaceae bacterium]